MADLHVLEPSVSDRDVIQTLKIKTAVVLSETCIPALGYARSFRIDPLLLHGGGGPHWQWPVPWPGTKEELAAELVQADNALNGGGYCGRNDRGALFHTLLCLGWPDLRCQVFEGRMEGQFAQLFCGGRRSGSLTPDFQDCFVPKGETSALADLHQRNLDEKQAIDALRHAFGGG